jgi:glutathione S-transferase
MTEEEYILNYFPVAGRGNQIKLIFEYTNQKYKNNIINFKDLPKLKKEGRFPFGQIPTIEKGNFMLAQGPAIVEYLSKKYGVWPKSEEEAALAMSIVLSCEDMRIKGVELYFSKNTEEKEKLKRVYEKVLGNWMNNITKILGEKKYLFENRITGADLAVLDIFQQNQSFVRNEKIDSYLKNILNVQSISKFYDIKKSKL